MIKNFSVKKKLIALIVGVSTGVLVFAGSVFFWAEEQSLKADSKSDLRSLTEVFASGVAPAIRNNDQKIASEILNALESDPSITRATIYRNDKSLLADYVKDATQSPESEQMLSVTRPILVDGESRGEITIYASLAGIEVRMREFAQIFAFIFVIAVLFALALAFKFQGIISRPLLYLAKIIQQVAASKNYSIRAESQFGDETGELMEGFNQMLAEIEKRERKLRATHDELELHVADRTQKLVLEIRERERVEQALRREEEQMRSLIRNAPVAMAMLDMQMRYVEYSDRWLNEFVLEKRSLHGLLHYEVFKGLSQNFHHMCERALRGEFGRSDEEILDLRNGERHFMNWTVQPWFRPDASQGGIIMVSVDVSDLVRARENALHMAQMKLQFLANLSHEVRTPLNAIIGFADLVSQSTLDQATRGFVETIESSGRLLLLLINDVLDFSKIESKKMVLENIDVSLRKVISQVVEMLGANAVGKGIELRVTIDPALPEYIKGDSTRLIQVLINLVGNAIKFTEQGEVTVTIGIKERIGNDILIAFEVRDSGIGIPDEMQGKIFDAFTQADGSTTRKFGGTGLGLAISARLVELMGGRIELSSTVGVGSSFSFVIRAQIREQLGESSPQRALEQVRDSEKFDHIKDKKILVVEDNQVNQKLIQMILTKSGFSVEIAENGVEALDKISREEFALVFMDLQMPIMGGIEATRRIRAQENPAQRLPIVALTAHAFPEDRDECFAAGVDEYLTKPINRRKLIETIHHYLAQRE